MSICVVLEYIPGTFFDSSNSKYHSQYPSYHGACILTEELANENIDK